MNYINTNQLMVEKTIEVIQGKPFEKTQFRFLQRGS